LVKRIEKLRHMKFAPILAVTSEGYLSALLN
jgi:hypothetical protein